LGIIYVVILAFGLVLFGWIIGIFVISLIFRFGMRIQIFAWSMGWLVQPFSAVYYPLSSLPLWVKNISLLLPTTYIFESMRKALNSNIMDWRGLIISYTINISLLILAYIFFERSVKVAKRKGMLTKYHE
jgi:ABC-2 type transport system permease protein